MIYKLYLMGVAALALDNPFYDIIMLCLTIMFCGYGLRPYEAAYVKTMTKHLLFEDLINWQNLTENSNGNYIYADLTSQKTKSKSADKM